MESLAINKPSSPINMHYAIIKNSYLNEDIIFNHRDETEMNIEFNLRRSLYYDKAIQTSLSPYSSPEVKSEDSSSLYCIYRLL